MDRPGDNGEIVVPGTCIANTSLFLIGVASFSGSLYVMAFTGMNLGYLTPFGGLAFIAG